MELRFPAPSADDPMPLDNSQPGKAPASPETSAAKNAAEPRLVKPFRRIPVGPTITSMTAAYRTNSDPHTGDLAPRLRDTEEDGDLGGSAATNGTAVPNSSNSNPASSPTGATPASSEPVTRVPRLRPRRRQRVRLRHLLPAWSVSLLVHVVILSALAAATFSAQDPNKKPISFNSALAGYRHGKLEELNIWADPDTIPRDQAVGKEHGGAGAEPVVEMSDEADGQGDDNDGGGTVVAAAFGGGAPSATPRFRGTGKRQIDEGNSLPNFKIEGMGSSPLGTLSPTPAADLYGGGKIAGDPVFDVQEIGVALDQLAREILRHLKAHKLTVVWLFDESISMQDDQRTIIEKFDRVSSELNKNIEPGKKTSGALNHAIVGFGQGFDFVLKKPTVEIDDIGRAIKKLRTDMSGVENTMQAIIQDCRRLCRGGRQGSQDAPDPGDRRIGR